MTDDTPLGVFEEQVLVAVLRTRDDAYGMAVRREIERVTGRDLTIGAVYATLDRLEAKGLVAREACPDDRRARFAVLTPAGRALMKRIFPRHAAAVSRALSGLNRDDRQAATRLLRTLGLAAAALESAPGTD